MGMKMLRMPRKRREMKIMKYIGIGIGIYSIGGLRALFYIAGGM